MRLLIVGTGPFAVPLLRDLVKSSHQVEGVVTKPVEDGGRRKQPANPVREVARELGLPCFEPPNINAADFLVELRKLQVDLMIVCDYGQILSAECLACAPLGAINLHGSLLPKYRGAAPIQRAIHAGETHTGVSVIHLTPRLDAGPVLSSATTPIGPEETAAELEPRLAELGVSAVREALLRIAAWDRKSPVGVLQDARAATRAPRISKHEGELDWQKSAVELHRQIRAFQPWPGSFTYWLRPGYEPQRLIVQRASVCTAAGSTTASPGTVIDVAPDRLVVACGQGSLALGRIQPAGKRDMEIADFLRGNPVRLGDRFQSSEVINENR